MSRRRGPVIALLLLGVAVVAVLIVRISPLWPGPITPADATPLRIATEAPHLIPTMGCALALLAPARIATDGDRLVLVSPETGQRIAVVWPSGWTAWRRDGRAELVTRDGQVVAREGELTPGYAGGIGLDDAFHVCIEGS